MATRLCYCRTFKPRHNTKQIAGTQRAAVVQLVAGGSELLFKAHTHRPVTWCIDIGDIGRNGLMPECRRIERLADQAERDRFNSIEHGSIP